MVQLVRGDVLTPESVITDGVVVHSDGTIVWVGAAADAAAAGWAEQLAQVPAAPGVLVLPGLVDVHNHGGGGASFPDASTAEQVRTAVAEHRSHGTAHVVASLVTQAPDVLRERVALLADLADAGEIAGIHLEGPFLSKDRCGAQDPELIVPGDVALVTELLTLGRGHVVTMTVAPESPGVLGHDGVVAALVAGGALPSWGHTDATAAQMREAIDAGGATLTGAPAARSRRTTVTHLCNGMAPMHHRTPGPVPEALAAAARGDVVVELVADGTHLDRELVRTFFELVGADNIALVTDAMAAAGMPDGTYRLGTQDVTVSGGVARLAEGGSIAGGTAHLLDVVRGTVAGGVPLVQAVRSASLVPAQIIGHAEVGRAYGALRPGYRADLLLVDAELMPLPSQGPLAREFEHRR